MAQLYNPKRSLMFMNCCGTQMLALIGSLDLFGLISLQFTRATYVQTHLRGIDIGLIVFGQQVGGMVVLILD
jgi:hypothetical protein